VGWLGLRQESKIHGRGFWIRPLLIEVGLGVGLALLYWWEIERFGLVQGQVVQPVVPPSYPLYSQLLNHTLLLCWMLAASFIDIDEKLVPDEITVSGTLLGLALATVFPLSLLPQVAERPIPPGLGVALANPGGGPAIGPANGTLWLEAVTAVAPRDWPTWWTAPRRAPSIIVAIACYWLWCFALAQRIWRGRRGAKNALLLIARRVCREFSRPPLSWLLLLGTAAIVLGWLVGGSHWAGLLTALVGLVGSGLIVWAVRIVGTLALRREAMGFGDVTLMMMVGTFLGWQACLFAFFLAPFAGLVIGLLQFLLRRDDVIPYVPYLCLASATVVVAWATIWSWGQELFRVGFLVPAVLTVCLGLLGILLFAWRLIKRAAFGLPDDE
jgi:prepilin signal peptidase PulO-like enzyme (type II secretory pathway)